jgi:asparagine synthetase B (glutamine-hydrolysing)
LVEFALHLPPELCVRPHERKWVLREATRNVLPEFVRTRIGKGVLYGLLTWSTANHGKYLEPLIADPILAQLGVIDAKKLRAAFAASRYERDKSYKLSPDVQYTLAVEAWLQVRSGRWQCGRHVKSTAISPLAVPSQGVLARR